MHPMQRGFLPPPYFPGTAQNIPAGFSVRPDFLPGFANLRLQSSLPIEEPRDPNISDKKLEEFRRSLFVPNIHSTISADELETVFRSFGNLQECIVKDTGSHRFAIVIYVEPESAYDVLCSKIVVNDKLIVCEPRYVGGRTYAPLVPMDVETPVRIQTGPGSGRGVPFSIVAEHLPVVPGAAYGYTEAFPSLNGPRYNGPVAMRAPILNEPPQSVTGFSKMLQGAPVVLPMTPQRPPLHGKTKPPPLSSTALVLKRMPFLGTVSDGFEQMRLLVHHVELKDSELMARDQVRAQLENTFRRLFRNCRLRLYGSSANTFGVRGSDIDAYLDLNLETEEALKEFPPRPQPIHYYFKNITQLQSNPYEPGELKHFTKQEILRLMEKLMRYLAKSMNWDYVHPIPEARTPILKLHQAHSNMSVDISFSSKMVFQNTGLLVLYSHLDARVRPLVYSIRRWAEMKQLTGESAFTKYALTMLLVFFLHQTKPAVLPTPEQIEYWMQSEHEEPEIAGEAARPSFSFDLPIDQIHHLAKIIPPSLNQSSAADLLLQFFNYYVNFPFSNHVMCGFTGEVIPIESFTVPEDGFRFRYINLQDPFDLAHNIAKSVSQQTFVTFRDFLRQEVAVFNRIPLNLIVLFDIDHVEKDLPMYPIMFSIGSNWKKPKADDFWIPKVADLTARILKDFFHCLFINEMTKEDVAGIPFNRSLEQLGPVLKDLHCRLECQSWVKRRNVRKQVASKMKITCLQDEWDVESAIGAYLHKTTHSTCGFDFYVTIMVNAVETEKVCIFLSSAKRSDTVRDFFDILWKFLPEQIRRHMRTEEPGLQVAPAPESEIPQPCSGNTSTDDLNVVA